ncbi:DNA translocase FtsK [Hujiaoplasma nucleasis]|uniref:DNA translocase FtsK n=1 Tax=Hujiaoplasma nucleasis TaxID=2725268 RepID=A0A7L6N6R1_9MOLU|nr:DNA translocase FtsK [Hujiaoplasma nucleasis]QLY40269.1 DNA translocase FtsK [Hujiaoplasma nucleasis]
MFFKKKFNNERIVPKTTRSKDNRPFYIPQITSVEDKKRLRQDFITPAGTSGKNVISVSSDRKGTGDIDKKYDAFRTNKRLTKEEAKKRFGHSYYEFISVNKKTLPKVYTEEGLSYDDVTLNKKVQEEDMINTEEIINDHKNIHSVPVDEFFESEKKHQEDLSANEVEEDDVLKDLMMNQEEKKDPMPLQFEEDEEESLDDILFEKAENKTMDVEDIQFDEDIDYEEYQPEQVPDLPKNDMADYQLPPLTLFKKTKETEKEEPAWVKENTEVINETMFAFGVDGKVTNHTMGPTVTRYEVSLGSGVPTKKITGISDNLQMNLSAVSLRIEAPIPGKNTIGIEVPNKTRKPVFFGDVIDHPKFTQSKDPLLLAVGLDIDALPVYTSIESMPHGLVAGSTQSGKSVSIAATIVSLIARNKPDELKLLLIDPKKVDLQQFSDLPHLITPIIDDTKIAIESLKWMVGEMERRYDVLKKFKAINVSDYYQRRFNDPNFEKMPRIVVIVEEASDLLLSGGNEIEESILKLTQKSRAVGIHIILATQRPSADILKGTIKANISTRFAFRVPSSTDSSVVLDKTGAEKLLGKGDMLLSENGLVRRIQGAYLSPEEIEKITDFIKQQMEPDYIFTHQKLSMEMKTQTDIEEIDELFKDVANYVVDEGKCSLNKITQEFGIGFNRANNIVNTLEKFGIVSANAGTKPREVLVDYDQLSQIFEGMN